MHCLAQLNLCREHYSSDGKDGTDSTEFISCTYKTIILVRIKMSCKPYLNAVETFRIIKS